MEISTSEQNEKLQEIIRKVRKIEGLSRIISSGSISGEYKSVFKSNGIEFDQVREYCDSDDSKMIDWNVTARIGEPYVKTFVEERDLNIYFLVDISASGNFSSSESSKREIAAEIAAVIGINALSRNDKISLLLFSDQKEKYIRPGKGRKLLWKILRDILYFSPENKQTDINEALSFFNKIRHTPGIVIIISDFLDQGFEQLVRRTAIKNTVILIRIEDPIEKEFPKAGIIEFTDAETGESCLIDTSDFQWRNQYSSLSREKLMDLRSDTIDVLEISTEDTTEKVLRGYFHYKARRGRFYK